MRKGIVLVSSAGNDGKNSGGIDAPASYPGTVGVAASTRSNRIASFSSRGRGIDITAPGNNILSTWLRGKYALLSGTSMASPHVAGGAALLLAFKPGLKPAGVVRAMKDGARKLSGVSALPRAPGCFSLAGRQADWRSWENKISLKLNAARPNVSRSEPQVTLFFWLIILVSAPMADTLEVEPMIYNGKSKFLFQSFL